MSTPGSPPTQPPSGGDGRRWFGRGRASDQGDLPSVEELEARVREQAAAADRLASLRTAAERAASEQAAERIVAEE